jgi:hypothetical protein
MVTPADVRAGTLKTTAEDISILNEFLILRTVLGMKR